MEFIESTKSALWAWRSGGYGDDGAAVLGDSKQGRGQDGRGYATVEAMVMRIAGMPGAY